MDTDILTPEPCRRCSKPLVRTTVWRSADRDQRAIWRATGAERQSGRNLCPKCYRACKLDGTLVDYPRSYVDAATVKEEWEAFVGTTTPYGERLRNVKLLAPRLGMTEDALERALDRLGIGTPQPAATTAPRNSTSCKTCLALRLQYGELVEHRRELTNRLQRTWGHHTESVHRQLDDNRRQLDRVTEDMDAHRDIHEAVAA